MKRISVHENQCLISEGEIGNCLYIVIDGEFLCTRFNSKSKQLEMLKTYKEAGSIFGEVALLTGSRRKATITALGNGSLFVIDEHTFERLI